jgi:hypothetical protein
MCLQGLCEQDKRALFKHTGCVLTQSETCDVVFSSPLSSPLLCPQSGTGNTPLHSAGRTGNVEEVKKLIAAGADVNAVNKVKCTCSLQYSMM